MSRVASKLGEMAATEIVPAIVGLYLGYRFLKWLNKKKSTKPGKI